jgi:hypothetical protein
LVDDTSVDVHMSLSCSETPNDDASNDDPEDDKICFFEKHRKGVGSIFLNKMGYYGKRFRKEWSRYSKSHTSIWKTKK